MVTFRRQGKKVAPHTHVDTDHVGCLKTRKSTSGGITRLGKHTIRTWSLTQYVVALSSGEAEYCGMVKGCFIFIGDTIVVRRFGYTDRHTHVH